MRPQGTADELERRRRRAVKLLGEGLGVRAVARMVGASPGSVTTCRQAFDRGGADALASQPHPGPAPKLDGLARGPAGAGAGQTAFRAAGWVDRHVTAARGPPGVPRLLVGDEPGGTRRRREYAARTWREEAFRDPEGGGFGRVDDPAHATRLLVVVARPTLVCLALGGPVVRRGPRRRLDPHPARRRSYCRLGLRWLARRCPAATGPPLPTEPPPP